MVSVRSAGRRWAPRAAGEPGVSRSELIDGVWGEDLPPSAVNALHVHVAGLRRALEPNRTSRAPRQFPLAAGPGYSLRLEPGQLDAQLLASTLTRPA